MLAHDHLPHAQAGAPFLVLSTSAALFQVEHGAVQREDQTRRSPKRSSNSHHLSICPYVKSDYKECATTSSQDKQTTQNLRAERRPTRARVLCPPVDARKCQFPCKPFLFISFTSAPFVPGMYSSLTGVTSLTPHFLQSLFT